MLGGIICFTNAMASQVSDKSILITINKRMRIKKRRFPAINVMIDGQLITM